MSFKPDHSPRTVALIGKFQSRDIAESLDLLAQALCARDIKVLIEADTAQHIGQQLTSFPWEEADYTRIGKTAELAIVIGGDGTFLAAARNLASYQVPLVGVNQGRLGFMTDIARADMIDCLDDLLAGRFIPGRRLLLEGEVLRNGTPLFPKSNFAVNDIVVDKGAIGRLIELELLINGEFIYNLRADGLIIATPTGSTAYALSAGGPILQPDLEGIAIVPLCPHALSNRPLIVPARGEIEIRIVQAEDARVYFDGQLTIDAHRGDSIKIHRASDGFYLLHPPGYSYFSMLRQKLHWSARPHG